MMGWHYFKDIYTDEFLRVGRFSWVLALFKDKSKYFSHLTLFKKLSKQFFKHS